MSRTDGVVIVLAILGIAMAYGLLWQPTGPGTHARIQVAGSPAQRVPLTQDRTIRLQGHQGESVVKVTDGRVRFVESACSNKICIRAGWLERGGDTAVCAPNGVSVQVASRNERYDAVNY